MFFSLLFSTKHLFFKIKRKSSKIIQKMLVSTFHTTGTAQKMIFFSLRISTINVTKPAGNWSQVTFPEEILNGKLHFLCNAVSFYKSSKHQATRGFLMFSGCIERDQ